jgi:hypothetical protein
MSRLATGIFGAIAVSLISGAIPFALGRDLAEAPRVGQQDSVPAMSAAGGNAVNRGAKADRASSVVGSPAQTRTIALRLDAFSDTSFLVRVPVTNGAGNSSSAPSRTKSGNRKITVACEPVVSVLTEVAKLLQPGRCVT